MSDLMSCETMNFSKLASTYDDFLVPAVKVTIGSTSYSSGIVKETKNGNILVITAVEANLYHSEGSSVSVTIEDAYDLAARCFKSVATLGESMTLEIGYGTKLRVVFKGFVGEITSDFNGTKHSIRVIGFDAVVLMRSHQASRLFSHKKYSEIVKEIIARYSGILTVERIESDGEKKQDCISGRAMDDYTYLMDVLCPLAGKEFFIFNGKAYFQRTSKRNKTPSVEFDLGKGLNDFRMTEAYANIEIAVRGITGAQESNQFLFRAKGKADFSQKMVGAESQMQYVQWMDTPDNEIAGNYAKYILERQLTSRQRAEGQCIGIPEIIPGRCIQIKGIRPALDKRKFWVDHVLHRIGKNGFSTEFIIKGWED